MTGRGGVVLRVGGAEVLALPAGSSLPLAELQACAEGRTDAGPPPFPAPAAVGRPAPAPPSADAPTGSVGEDAAAAEAAFQAAVDARDADGAVAAVLALEAALDAWGADPTQSDERTRARATFRGLVTRLGQAAGEGLVDRRDIVAPFVEALLTLRRAARSEKRWADADHLRDIVVAAGIEIRDHTDGTDWSVL